MCGRFRLRGCLAVACLLAVLLALGAARPASAEGERHTVQAGETLRTIAEMYGVTVEALATTNQLVNPNLIFAGQVLEIPGAGEELAEETEGVDIEDDAAEEVERVVHVVQPGETLTRIAARYGVTTADILRLNRLANPNIIFAGQRLTIQGSAESVAVEEQWQAVFKRIVVDKSEQRAYVYEDGDLLWTFVISTGMPGSETWEGTFAVRSKIVNAYAQLWGLQMPYWLGFYHTGYLENGFHALPIMPSGAVLWDGYLGTPVSYGCVILSHEDAAALFQWAEIGTEVVVRP